MQGRFNSMQKSMVQWNELYPYSAVHAVRLRCPLEATRLRACINSVLERRGLNRLVLNMRLSAFQYQADPVDYELRTLASAPDPSGAVVTEMERQLNLPFDHTGPFSPFRFFAMPAGDSCFLGLTYFHPAADAESVVWLLKDIVDRQVCRELGAGETARAPELYPDHRARLLSRHLGVVARKLAGTPAQMRNLRQSHRARYLEAGNMTTALACFSTEPEELSGLLAAAKAWSVTVNDLLMALLMKALSPCAVGRLKARKRNKLSIGCIVNVRKDLGLDSRATFGVFLGAFTVTHQVPEAIRMRDLAEGIRAQTAPIKRHKLYLATPLNLGLARFMQRFFSPERRKKFYSKYYPLWGGITNMNVNRVWDQADRAGVSDYLRGVSTGPVTPLAMSVTTIGDRLNLGISYRTAVFGRSEIEALGRRLREYLQEIRQTI